MLLMYIIYIYVNLLKENLFLVGENINILVVYCWDVLDKKLFKQMATLKQSSL